MLFQDKSDFYLRILLFSFLLILSIGHFFCQIFGSTLPFICYSEDDYSTFTVSYIYEKVYNAVAGLWNTTDQNIPLRSSPLENTNIARHYKGFELLGDIFFSCAILWAVSCYGVDNFTRFLFSLNKKVNWLSRPHDLRCFHKHLELVHKNNAFFPLDYVLLFCVLILPRVVYLLVYIVLLITLSKFSQTYWDLNYEEHYLHFVRYYWFPLAATNNHENIIPEILPNKFLADVQVNELNFTHRHILHYLRIIPLSVWVSKDMFFIAWTVILACFCLSFFNCVCEIGRFVLSFLKAIFLDTEKTELALDTGWKFALNLIGYSFKCSSFDEFLPVHQAKFYRFRELWNVKTKMKYLPIRNTTTKDALEIRYLTMDDIIAHVREGNALQVRLWLDNTENDLNQGDDHRFSLLHWSAREGRLAIVELLIQRGARVNATNMGDDTPLHLAAAHGHRDVVHSLIGHKACINAINEHGNTPLHYACFWNHIEVAELLVNNNASVLIENKYGETPLEKARPRTSQILENLARALGQTMQRQPYRDISYLGTKTRSRDATLARFEGTLDPMQLQFRQRISVNHGGEVWIGAFKGHEVAVKLLRLKQCTIRHSHDFNEEVLKLRIFNHPNISPVLGSVNSPPKLCLLSYYMPYGSLHNVLHGDNETIMVDAKQALRFALDIASAMEFLHTPELKVTNYRLNSKHVMIDENLAKICSPFENSDHKMVKLFI